MSGGSAWAAVAGVSIAVNATTLITKTLRMVTLRRKVPPVQTPCSILDRPRDGDGASAAGRFCDWRTPCRSRGV